MTKKTRELREPGTRGEPTQPAKATKATKATKAGRAKAGTGTTVAGAGTGRDNGASDSGTAGATGTGAGTGTDTGTGAGTGSGTGSGTGTAKAGTVATRRPRGRPARAEADGAPDTREQILASARQAFAEHGYDKASVRAIARGAGVDSALVHHYFGTKEQVFAAAVAAAAAPAATALQSIPKDHPAAVGEQMVRFFLGIWENPQTRGPLLAIARSALTNDTAARIFRGFIMEQVVRHMAAKIDGADAPLRVQLAAAQLVGTAILRYLLSVEPLASAPLEEVIGRLIPVVQGHLTGEPPPSPRR